MTEPSDFETVRKYLPRKGMEWAEAHDALDRIESRLGEFVERHSPAALLAHVDSSQCAAVCDHSSRCELPADHLPATRHEGEHCCIFYSDVSPAVRAAREASALRRKRIAEWETWDDAQRMAWYLGSREACDAATAAVLVAGKALARIEREKVKANG